MEEIQRAPIQFSCYSSRSRVGENFVSDHAISFVVSGTTTLDNGLNQHAFTAGNMFFCRRNQLLKFVKNPPEGGGEYRSVSMYFTQDLLREFSIKYGYSSLQKMDIPGYIKLDEKSVLANYMNALREYETLFNQQPDSPLYKMKQEEAILLLLKAHPELAGVLFDFSEPGKIDLEAFMQQNYHFNVDISRFAYLTGRSLSGFKRDFEKIFEVSPGRWLLQRRLKEAYTLLKEKKRAVSDVYLELGFEDLSHFSFAFKKKYGMAPSQI
jgi:AraC-like DNA-binding protein